MLDQDEFKSIWEIVFRWEDIEPPENDSTKLPNDVKKKLEKLIWAFREEQLTLRDKEGLVVYDDRKNPIDLFFFNKTRKRLKKCYRKKYYPKSELDYLFIKRGDLLKWCKENFTILPTFWIDDVENPSSSDIEETQSSHSVGSEQKALLGSLVNGLHRQKNSKFDSIICQTIARVLWDEYPQMTIADMKKHKAIHIYGNGRAYSGKNTVRDWLSIIDPRSPKDKSGRKKKNSHE